jgi:branched-chain amino acid transport system substrate-binding protein
MSGSLPKSTEVRIGFDYHLTGTYAKIGEDARRTFEMIINEINTAGGVKSLGGLKFRAVWADHQGKPEVAMAEAERLITQKKVTALFGARLSSCTLPVGEVCEQYEIPLLVGDSTSPKLTDGRFKWLFRVVPNEDMCSYMLFHFLREVQRRTGLEIKTVAYVYEDSLYGKGCAESWKKNNADPVLGGYTVVADIPYSAETSDVSSEVLKLKTAGPNVVFMSSYAADALLYAKTYKGLDYYPEAILTVAEHNKPGYVAAIAGTDLGDYYCNVVPWNPDVKKSRSAKFAERYYSLYGERAHVNCVGWYTCFWTFYKALEKAGSLEPGKIRDALRTVEIPSEEIPSVGSVKFDWSGQNIKAGLVITQFLDGRYRTVFPWNVASVGLVFPAPSWAERKR